ncbi:MAG: YggS family pyridoxal phosphate-dependent enzyme [Candidatus Omnitrophica bacterium]|nr:YggS family pyridoxal phosphate-dependent enzyme [Candidatus Omnitrophota bacterium]
MTVRANLAEVRERIRRAAGRSGRDPDAVELLAVTKNAGWDDIREAYEAGQRKFGENRVQDLTAKREALPQDAEWHLIGHLQTNKVKEVVGRVRCIHSVDSVRLAEKIAMRADEVSETVPVLIQVNTSGESTKHGVPPEGAGELIEFVAALPQLRLEGLMTIGPLGGGEAAVRESFRKLFRIREDWTRRGISGLKYLSMGMTQDFEIAVEEGASLVRVGTAIFGGKK